MKNKEATKGPIILGVFRSEEEMEEFLGEIVDDYLGHNLTMSSVVAVTRTIAKWVEKSPLKNDQEKEIVRCAVFGMMEQLIAHFKEANSSKDTRLYPKIPMSVVAKAMMIANNKVEPLIGKTRDDSELDKFLINMKD